MRRVPKPSVVGCMLALFGAAVVQAQQAPASSGPTQSTRWHAGVGIATGLPVGEFANHVDGAVGALGHVDRRVGESVFRVGGELSYLGYGAEHRIIALGNLVPEIPNAAVKVKTTNNMLLLHARARAQRREGRWRPYGEGLFGFVDLVTKSSFEGPEACSQGYSCVATNLAEATHSRDFEPSYGGGAGISLAFQSRPASPRLDFSLRYLHGSRARYLTEGAVRRDGGNVTLDFSRSRTDMIAIYIGVSAGG
jgi:hypothetical protein